jgi:hypothetical protein
MLPESPQTTYYKLYYAMIEDGPEQDQLTSVRPFGAPPILASVVRELHRL